MGLQSDFKVICQILSRNGTSIETVWLTFFSPHLERESQKYLTKFVKSVSLKRQIGYFDAEKGEKFDDY